MAVQRMKKLSLVALRRDADKLARTLLWAGSVQLTPLDAARASALPTPSEQPPGSSAAESRRRVESALSMIGKYREKSPPPVRSRAELQQLGNDLPDAASASDRLWALKQDCEVLQKKEDELTKEITRLTPWETLPFAPQIVPFPVSGVCALYGTLPASEPFETLFDSDSAPAVWAQTVRDNGTTRFVSVFCRKADQQPVLTLLLRHGFARTDLESGGNIAERLTELRQAIKQNDRALQNAEDEIRSLACHGPALETLYDYYGLQLQNRAVREKFVFTSAAVALQGWIPATRVDALEKKLARFQCYYTLEDPTPEEEPPVALHNDFFSTPFESIIELYSLPKYRAFDPTRIMAFFYFIIFGLMVADIGYGVLITLGCLLFLRLKKPKEGMKRMLMMFAWCGLSSTAAGVLFGGCFGDLPQSFAQNMLGIEGEVNLALWFSPMSDPLKMLYFSLAVGGVHVLCGMLISVYVKCKRGDVFGAFTNEIAWIAIFAGIALFALLDGLAATLGLVLAGIGALSIILFSAREVKNPAVRIGKGLYGLYGIMNFASDVLSYSRIMALGLSGAVIANVMNLLGTLGGPSVGGIILFAILFPLGTALNLAISLLGVFVHTARLQYIEFFGKFYEDGGERFIPERAELRYVALAPEPAIPESVTHEK